MTTLGNNGRLGNQLFQYGFLRSYAEVCGYSYGTPHDWIGRKWFPNTSHDAVIAEKFPTYHETDFGFGLDNIDLWGYYQNQKSLDFLCKSRVKSWYRFDDEILENFKKPRDFYIAVHVRRGDYMHHPLYPTILKQCYIDRIIENGFDPKDIVWVEEGVKTEGDLGLLDDPLYDFLTIQNADVVFRCNSTFSWWAGALNEKSQIYSPVVTGHLGVKNAHVPFVFGNHPTPTVHGKYHTDLHWE
jgi:hypothetical protein